MIRAFSLFSAALLLSSSALAQGVSMPSIGGGGGPSRPMGDTARPNDNSSVNVADKSSRLFDLSTTTSGLQLDLGPVWYRRAAGSKGFDLGTGEIALGLTVTNAHKPFYLAGHHKLVFRAFDSKSYHFSFTSEIATGLAWGPFEIESRIGINLVNLGAFHGEWSAELASPRVAAAAALHLWRFRVDIQAHSEYLWRWFGSDYLVRGITLGLRLDLPRPQHPLTQPGK